MSIFVGVIPALVIIECSCVLYWMNRFQQRLIAYVEGLNEISLHGNGVEFYYRDLGCCGKSTNILGIRKHEEQTSLLV